MKFIFRFHANVDPILDGHFRGCSRMEGGSKRQTPLPEICHTYRTIMKLGTVIPYLKKIQKIYESPDKPPEFFWHSIFSLEISFLYQEIQIKISFWWIISNSFNISPTFAGVDDVTNKILSRDSIYDWFVHVNKVW